MAALSEDAQFWTDGEIAPELLIPHPRNPKKHPPEQIAQIRGNIREFGFTRPVLITADLLLLAGHGATEAAILEGLPSIPYRMRSAEHPLTEAQVLALLVSDNRLPQNGMWDEAELAAIMGELKAEDYPLDITGFSLAEADSLLAGFGAPAGQNQGQGAASPPAGSTSPTGAGSLAERFLLPPFSVLNAREGWWQQRKATWIALGIRSEIGRGSNLIGRSPQELFCHFTGIAYNEARAIVAAAMQEQGEAFDVDALIDKYGRKPGADFGRSGAVVPNGPGGLVAQLGAARGWDKLAPGGTGANSAWLRRGDDGYAPPGGGINGSGDEADAGGAGTSIFDPVLCEIAYRWFCPPGGVVLDPFAGGSVRGILAAKLGRSYCGVELRAEQIAANEEQARDILGDEACRVIYHEGDARELAGEWFADQHEPVSFDLLFACPPYFDLEQYSDDPRDLSNMAWDDFLAGYYESIRRACSLLAADRFAVFVVGEVRDRQGNYRGLVPHTIIAFEAAGLSFYNEAILVTAVGSLPIRAGRTFAASRKLGKTHQNVLVFVKGDGAAAAQACGLVDVVDPLELINAGVIQVGALDVDAMQEATANNPPGEVRPLDEIQSLGPIGGAV